MRKSTFPRATRPILTNMIGSDQYSKQSLGQCWVMVGYSTIDLLILAQIYSFNNRSTDIGPSPKADPGPARRARAPPF